MTKVYVLLSAYNESKNDFFWKTIDQIQALSKEGYHFRLIIAATKGTDSTFERLEALGVPFVVCETNSRGERYHQAWQSITDEYDFVVFHHPRSLLDKDALVSLSKIDQKHLWGAFTHKFDSSHPLLKFTSWWSNNIRGDMRGIFYLDHCIYVRKKLMDKVGGFPREEIFEDTLFSIDLLRSGHPFRLSPFSLTSSIRFQSNGIWKQSLMNQWLKILYLLGWKNQKLNRHYEKGLNLNAPD